MWVGHLFCSFIPNLFRSPTVIPWYGVCYILYGTWIALYNTLFIIIVCFYYFSDLPTNGQTTSLGRVDSTPTNWCFQHHYQL